ncbi:MAG: tRNA uridine(34) 5-carboxymethylaminomethyl modification radical SAM/GNAT enzyme Elp3, partial [Candidatus Hydrothermarchaeaceae archaeon]
MSSKALKEIIAGLKDGRDIAPLKKAVAKKYGLSRIPTNPQILAAARAKDRIFLEPLLRKKPVRTISGIAVIAVMARPYECPGRCIYCPTGKDSPKSYTGKEPATMRAKRAGYDPYLQVRDRINQLRQIGHITDKAELIVMGGTFTSQPLDYQEWFVKRCIVAMNSFSGKIEWNTLEDAQEVNEKAEVRNVGITFETRPDYAKEKEADRML